ncbi:MAG: SDR family NAD(P)-dependent oxidoreductase [Acidimicrobiales bacterium]|nr:SDR family NAD(P)-dependent oxidoreductase [Acidimicrobiales bacterium]
MDPQTKGRTVLVTGASSGMGAAVARELAARGDTVALVARRADRLDEVLADCRATSATSERWAADLSDPTAAADLALEIWDHYGGLDVVVNNAGVPMRRGIHFPPTPAYLLKESTPPTGRRHISG